MFRNFKIILSSLSKLSLLTLFLLFSSQILCDEDSNAKEVGNFKNSFSIQLGLNGAIQRQSSFGLQFIPPDLSYSRELLKKNDLSLSTASFYDNIGVQVDGNNFTYRIGQRFDIAYEIGTYSPYITTAAALIHNHHTRNISPVYGFGLLKKINERILWVNEINFQEVNSHDQTYGIINFSTGLNFLF